MPFSSGRSVRAPASKATRIVVARVPSRATRWIGRPLGAVLEVICGIADDDSGRAMPVAGAAKGQGPRRAPAKLHPMETTEADIRTREGLPAEQAPPRPVVIEFSRVTKL